ncbi:MAG: DUF4301 family protein [Paludibacteraceae bacterium]|nr:DUF4301 family protein [Paludibacteraceae bacterium]
MEGDFTKDDYVFLRSKGIDRESANEQLEVLRADKSYPDMVRTATLGDGIKLYSKVEEEEYVDIWKSFLEKDKQIYHFIPSSGCAGRFFRELYSFMKAPYVTPQTSFEKNFFKHLQSFAFYNELNKVCINKEDKGLSELMELGKFKLILDYLLTDKGLSYGKIPHALFKFHTDKSKTFTAIAKYLPKSIVKYSSSWEDTRTPIQESLLECAMVSGVRGGNINVCYSVKREERDIIQDFVREFKLPVEKKFGLQCHVTLPIQEKSTDTISVDSHGNVIRDENGKIVLKPSGHGALFSNVCDLQADIVFFKNIDNESSDTLKKLTSHYKKVLAGVLVKNCKKIKRYMRLLDKDDVDDDQLIEIINFVENILNVKRPQILRLSREEQISYLRSKLNRPLRVCGMVKNEDEHGGMPCWVKNPDGTLSLHIVEYYQVCDNPELMKIFNSSTHFNPVDIVCSLSDYKGKRFDLSKFADLSAWIPYNKNLENGETVRRLDRPGLWNGCMADWNTIFVEVPIKTFNPVKTINDLLRQEHQN